MIPMVKNSDFDFCLFHSFAPILCNYSSFAKTIIGLPIYHKIAEFIKNIMVAKCYINT